VIDGSRLVAGGVGGVFGDFDGFYPDAVRGLGAGVGVGPGVGVGGEGLAADRGEHAQLDQALGVQGAQGGEFGVVGGGEGGVVEGFVQPGAQGFEAAEVDAPAAVVEGFREHRSPGETRVSPGPR